jgi:hypothetical protein
MRFVPRAVVLVVLLACGGDGSSTNPPESGPAVTTILVSGPSGSLQVGATFALSAEVRDQAGAAIAGKTPSWTSANNSIASVSGAGVVTAVASGTTAISAAVDGKTGFVNVTVTNPPVFAVTITPLAAAPIAGQSTPLAVVVSDRSGTTLIGRRVTWSSSATLVATVDAAGQLSASSPGTTTLTASSEGVSGSLAITVVAPEGSTPPAIASVAPVTLAPGTTATIRGTGFLGAATTAVTIAGVRAAVLEATATDLTVAVPTTGLPCQVAQPSPITVATVGGMATASHPLTVARTRDLAVGESFVAAASGDIGCNALPSGASYIVSVFNGAAAVSATTRFELRGSVGGASAARLPVGEPLTIDAAATRRSLAPSALSGAQRQHLDRLDEDLNILRRLGPPRRSTLAPSYSRAASAPVPLSVGATTTVKFHYSSCTAAGASNVTARVVFVGQRSVVLEDVAGPLAGKLDADLVAMGEQFESVSYPLLLNFGDPLARDQRTDANGRIVMLFTPKVNEVAANILGFVSACDLYPVLQDPSVAGSNEAEIFYARAATDEAPGNATLDGVSQWRRQMPATMIHEAKHIVSYAERLARAATQFEQVWLEEATAQVASEMFGRAIRGNAWRSDATYQQTLYCEARPTTAGCAGGVIAMTNHFAFLSSYLQNFETKSIISGADDSDIYGSAWLFIRWLVDTYGGADEGALLRQLVQNERLTGILNVEAAVGRTFPQLLAEFTLMLAADNLPGVGGPHMEPSWNLPDIFTGSADAGTGVPAPLTMRKATGGVLSVSGRNVKGGGAVLMRFGPAPPGTTQLLELKSTPTAPLAPASTVGMAVLRIE